MPLEGLISHGQGHIARLCPWREENVSGGVREGLGRSGTGSGLVGGRFEVRGGAALGVNVRREVVGARAGNGAGGVRLLLLGPDCWIKGVVSLCEKAVYSKESVSLEVSRNSMSRGRGSKRSVAPGRFLLMMIWACRSCFRMSVQFRFLF